jgi:membrane protein DedA with SNARE-associated domain
VLFATIGSLVGALVAYAIGYWGGRPLLMRWGRFLRFTEDDLVRTEGFFERWGSAAALIGRMVPVVRSLVSFGAGVGRMRLGPFVLFTILGSVPWNAALILTGYLMGENWNVIGGILKQYEYLVLAILVVAALAWIWFRFIRPRGSALAG